MYKRIGCAKHYNVYASWQVSTVWMNVIWAVLPNECNNIIEMIEF